MHHEGDHSRGICNHCKRIVSTTFWQRDLSVEETKQTLHGILVAVCDECGDTIAVPASSTEAIRKQLC